MSEKPGRLNRRDFLALGTGVLGSIGLACGGGQKTAGEQMAGEGAPAMAGSVPAKDPYAGFRVGVQSYCFREFKTQDELIGHMKTLGLSHIEIWPGGHLPVESSDSEIKAYVQRFKDNGITIDACGVMGFTNDEDDARRKFEYAKKLGVLAISAGPQHDALPLMAKLTEEYDLPIAIHNHGPEDKLYGTSELVREYLVPMPTRVGLCLDTGHAQRVGEDAMDWVNEFGDRIQGVHLKDMVPGEGERWVDAIIGKGRLDLVSFVKKLDSLGFDSYMSLEYESNPSNPIPEMQECLAELRKACATIA